MALERARYLATQAREPVAHYEHREVGYNYRLSNVLAALGLSQLSDLYRRIASRRRHFEAYREALGGLPGLDFMPIAEEGEANYWLSCLTVDPARAGVSRDELIAATRALDRVVMSGRYFVPLYYLDEDYWAWWGDLAFVDVDPVFGYVLESWWMEPSGLAGAGSGPAFAPRAGSTHTISRFNDFPRTSLPSNQREIRRRQSRPRTRDGRPAAPVLHSPRPAGRPSSQIPRSMGDSDD